MVTADGVVKITDFGIARGGGATVTQTGQVMGTAQYVSPEQATGRKITPASDLYSLGVVAYECLAGMPPFAADTPIALALMHVREDAPPLPMDVPPAVRGLVSALMAKDPEDRPAGAHKVADQIHLLRESGGGDPDDADAATRAVPVGDAGPVSTTRSTTRCGPVVRRRWPECAATPASSSSPSYAPPSWWVRRCSRPELCGRVRGTLNSWTVTRSSLLGVLRPPSSSAGCPTAVRRPIGPEPSESVPSGPIPFPTPSFTTFTDHQTVTHDQAPNANAYQAGDLTADLSGPATPSSSPEGALGSEGRA